MLSFLKPIILAHLTKYGTPSSITNAWSFGSLLGIMMTVQVITGIVLAMHYCPSIVEAFDSVEHIMRDVRFGWFLRYAHANGASIIFILTYAHMFRGLFFRSYRGNREYVWYSGVIIYVLLCGAAFLGYILPWGQMGYWGATVITNLVTAVPYVGKPLVTWIWGGFGVNNATLNRFFVLHFILPLLILVLAVVHIQLLHSSQRSSSNPLSSSSSILIDNIRFIFYFIAKDAFALSIFFIFYILLVLMTPNLLGHPVNWVKADALVTPPHIVPEWYFLPFYAILKTIPSKLGGVVAMGLSIAILLILPKVDGESPNFQPFSAYNVWTFIFFSVNVTLLGWLGSQAVGGSLVYLSWFCTVYYFAFFTLFLPSDRLHTHKYKLCC